MENDLNFELSYGIAHTKQYKPSIISQFLSETDEGGRLVHVNSDVYLLTRQDSLIKKIGVESVRAYIAGMLQTDSQQSQMFTDEQLFSLIEPKEVNNLTTRYEFMQYFKKSHDKLKARYDKLKESSK